ncbi:MAG TPA: hypothetical protein VHZ97_24850 [Pseudonocardiaceae bacterium]|nr:hypothetical protein [Pseudonocardiaceae bacterium]
MGAVISFEVDEDDEASFADLPWLVTFEPDDDEAGQQWDSFSCGPYLRDHALAIAEAVAFDQDGVIAVVAPVLPALTPEDVTAIIDERRAEATAAGYEDDEDDEFEDDDEIEAEDLDVDEVEEDDDVEEEDDADEAEFDEAEFDDEEDDDEDDDDLDVVEVDVEELEVPLPEEVRAGIETVLQRLLAHTAPVAEPESA